MTRDLGYYYLGEMLMGLQMSRGRARLGLSRLQTLLAHFGCEARFILDGVPGSVKQWVAGFSAQGSCSEIS